MKTKINSALAAEHRIDPDRWWDEFGGLIDRIAPRFTRYEPLQHASALMLGLLSGLDRKNCWTIAERLGDSTPDALQHMLSRSKWDADAVRDDVRDYVVKAFVDPDGVLIVDETRDLEKGTATVGVQWQYTGTAGRIENAQVAVYLTYAGPRGHALIDRALYLPASWTRHRARWDAAGVPVENREFATKPALAQSMIGAALDAGTPVSWVTGDEVYGADPRRASRPRVPTGRVRAGSGMQTRGARGNGVGTSMRSSAGSPRVHGRCGPRGSGARVRGGSHGHGFRYRTTLPAAHRFSCVVMTPPANMRTTGVLHRPR